MKNTLSWMKTSNTPHDDETNTSQNALVDENLKPSTYYLLK
jgi:hypothetical protein